MNNGTQWGRAQSQIDWYQFLARPRLPSPSLESLKPLQSAAILVTGAAGSIGSELSLRLAAMNPRRLVLLDFSEQGLYRLQARLSGTGLPCKPCFVLGGVTDSPTLDEVFAEHSPEYVFHAAAYKHVATLEEHPLAAIANNVLGTQALVTCVRSHGTARIVLVSTDKAVEPISILGATKYIAEQITLAHNGVAVRLANVLGTQGSVVETFLHQITIHQALNIRHRDAERYFLTCEEAVDLILAAAIESSRGNIVVPKIEQSHSIESLARFLSKAVANEDQPDIVFGELHAGEKVHEALWAHEEQPMEAASNGYCMLKHNPRSNSLGALLAELSDAVQDRNVTRALELVVKLVPGYRPSSTVLALAQPTAQGVLQP